ncbi:surface lipoprotein assembly modifier [Sulfitobacter sp. THAF37]|uniref:surface lipoprotein assembly modifier n=1 Tax=Sulfitobacter sp. THAF37 TaxID=2587855 RepID=UPI00156217DB|nr:surface lipoprotein assembly modifier [Sulfitobacter sp. THAF37]
MSFAWPFRLTRSVAVICTLCLLLAGAPLRAQQSLEDTWLTAVGFVQAGEPGRALPLIERLVSARPRNKKYRFELALALFRLGRDGRAKFHLEQLRGADLTPQERQVINRMIGAIDARRVWSGYFGLNIRPESNGTKQTEDRVLVIGGLPLTLDETAIGKATVSTIVTTGLTFAPEIGEGMKARLSLDAYLKHNSEVALRDYILTGRTGLSYTTPQQRYWDGGLLLGTRRAADRPYSETVGLYLNHARRVGNAGTLRLGGEVSRTFRRRGLADIDRMFLSVGYTHAVGGNAQLSFTGFVERNDSAQLTTDGLRRGLNLSGLYAFDGGLMTSLTLRGEMDDRTGVSRLFGAARSDRKLAADLRVYHRDFRIGSFAPEIQFGIERNRSNIPLADYTNRYLSIGLTRKF